MANTEKMTKKDFYELIKSETSRDEVREFCDHQIELLAKAKKSDKPTAKQLENEKIKSEILENLKGAEVGLSITEINALPAFVGYSNQKLTRLVTDLVKEEKLVRDYAKRKATFTVKEQ